MDLPVTEDQIALWESGVLAQHAFQALNGYEREFIMTGIIPEEWDELIGEEYE